MVLVLVVVAVVVAVVVVVDVLLFVAGRMRRKTVVALLMSMKRTWKRLDDVVGKCPA